MTSRLVVPATVSPTTHFFLGHLNRKKNTQSCFFLCPFPNIDPPPSHKYCGIRGTHLYRRHGSNVCACVYCPPVCAYGFCSRPHRGTFATDGSSTGSVRPDLPTSGSVRHQFCADMLKCVVVDMKCAQRQHFTFTRTRNLFDSLEPNEHGEHVMVLMDLETVLDEPTFPT